MNILARLHAALIALLLASAAPVAAEQPRGTELVMIDQKGCAYCEKWEAEIGPIYPNTAEGAFAPLRRVHIRNSADAIELVRRVNFTPTFLVVRDGREIARLEGYPGEDFFWPLLTRMLTENTEYTGGNG